MTYENFSYGYEKFFLNKALDVEYLIAGFHSPFFKNQKNVREIHDFWEMIFVGTNQIHVQTSERSFVLQKDHAFFHKPYEIHQHTGDSNADSEIYVISFHVSGESMKNFENKILHFTDENIDTLKTIMKLIGPTDFMPNRNISDFDRSLIKLYTEKLLMDLLKQESEKLTSSISKKNFAMILHVLNKHVYERLTLPEIAQLCNLSESNLKKTFQLYSDKSIMNYFNYLKVLEAKKLIRQGISLNEISSILSFSSPSYFSVFFKRETGMSPTDYRTHLLNDTI